MNTEQNAQSENDSWVSATDDFLSAVGTELGARYAPQTKALRELAKALDAAETYDTMLAAEYARMHRWMLNKTNTKSSSGSSEPEGPDLLDMLNQNPGVRWNQNA